MDWRIEELDSDTARRLDRLHPEVFDNAIVPEQLRAFIDDPRHLLFMAIVDDVVVGMASGVEYFHPDKRPNLWINEVGVAPDFQCRGIGRALVGELLDAARSRGCKEAWLGTEPDNDAANACYRAVPDVEDAEPFLLYEWELD
ncbi:MAG: GNAT family N-acetyltransferase [Pseudomonadota bacterium]